MLNASNVSNVINANNAINVGNASNAINLGLANGVLSGEIRYPSIAVKVIKTINDNDVKDNLFLIKRFQAMDDNEPDEMYFFLL